MQIPATERPRHPWRSRVAALAAASTLVLVAACGSSDDTSSSNATSTTVSADVLGPPNPASGDPVKVGFVSDGRTATVDNSAMAPAAKATVDYLNDYRAGIGGRPIDLITCETAGEPGKATDCANQLVQDGVVLTIMPETIQATAVHTVMAANHIPLFVYAATDTAILEDPDASFIMGNLTAALSELPIDAAREGGIDKVTVVVVDVPAATAFYDPGSYGAQQFEDAGIDLEEVKVPLGAADLSQQVNEIVTGGPTVVQVVGDPSVCISAINGLRTNGFDGPITTVPNCITDATKTAIGANLDGVVIASNTPFGDSSNSGIQLWNAILAKYAPNYQDPSQGLSSFTTTMSAQQALLAITGDITADTVTSTIKAAPEQPLVTGAGLGFRCNGKAAPPTPAVCTRGALKVTLDDHGNPELPYVAFGTSPIPD